MHPSCYNRRVVTIYLKWQNLLSQSLGDWKSKSRVPAWLCSGEGLLPGYWQMTCFSPHGGKRGSELAFCPLIRGGINPILLTSTLTTVSIRVLLLWWNVQRKPLKGWKALFYLWFQVAKTIWQKGKVEHSSLPGLRWPASKWNNELLVDSCFLSFIHLGSQPTVWCCLYSGWSSVNLWKHSQEQTEGWKYFPLH